MSPTERRQLVWSFGDDAMVIVGYALTTTTTTLQQQRVQGISGVGALTEMEMFNIWLRYGEWCVSF